MVAFICTAYILCPSGPIYAKGGDLNLIIVVSNVVREIAKLLLQVWWPVSHPCLFADALQQYVGHVTIFAVTSQQCVAHVTIFAVTSQQCVAHIKSPELSTVYI